eukprot:1157303-Pelagomonas_calceolata.AAC.7
MCFAGDAVGPGRLYDQLACWILWGQRGGKGLSRVARYSDCKSSKFTRHCVPVWGFSSAFLNQSHLLGSLTRDGGDRQACLLPTPLKHLPGQGVPESLEQKQETTKKEKKLLKSRQEGQEGRLAAIQTWMKCLNGVDAIHALIDRVLPIHLRSGSAASKAKLWTCSISSANSGQSNVMRI